jgi:hypothetical protein
MPELGQPPILLLDLLLAGPRPNAKNRIVIRLTPRPVILMV